MKNKVVAIVDGALFDSFIEFKSIMEHTDENLKTVKFVHKDKLSKAKASGDFISAPLAFIVAPIKNKEDYKRELEEAKRIKSEFEISVCTLIFSASKDVVFSDDIKDVRSIGCEIFDLVTSLHIIHEEYSPEEEIPLKTLALISGLTGSHSYEDEIGFTKDYMTVTMSVNYENLNSTLLLIFDNLHTEVKGIKKEISDLNEEKEAIERKKSKKYECHFSSQSSPETKNFSLSVPSKPEDMLLFCKTYATTLLHATEDFAKSSEAYITTAQHALSRTFDRLCVKDEVDPDVLEITTFKEGELPYKSEELIQRPFGAASPQVHKISSLIPLLKAVINADNLDLGTALKLVLLLLSGALIALGTYVVPSAIKSGTAIFTNSFLGILFGILAIILLSAGIAFLVDIFSKTKLKRYIKNFVEESSAFFSDSSKSDTDIREYINKFVTVSVNSFIKTRKIDIAENKISELKKKKDAILKYVTKLRKKTAALTALHDTDLYDPAVAIDTESLKERIRQNSVTAGGGFSGVPEIDNCLWIKEILFEITF